MAVPIDDVQTVINLVNTPKQVSINPKLLRDFPKQIKEVSVPKIPKNYEAYFYRFTNLFADNEIILDMGEFVLFTKEINQEIIKIKTDKPFIRSELSAVGFKKFGIKYLRSKRKFGKTKFGIFNLLAYAMTGFLSASTFFLRFNAASGTFLLIVNIIFGYLFIQNTINLDFLIFVNTVYLLLISIFTSIYLARTHNNILSRSVYVIDKKQSFNNSKLI